MIGYFQFSKIKQPMHVCIILIQRRKHTIPKKKFSITQNGVYRNIFVNLNTLRFQELVKLTSNSNINF